MGIRVATLACTPGAEAAGLQVSETGVNQKLPTASTLLLNCGK